MNCENEFCIYEQKGKCSLDEISIDITGQCSECIYLDIPKPELDNYKSVQKNKIINF